jgi:hypothetical protein
MLMLGEGADGWGPDGGRRKVRLRTSRRGVERAKSLLHLGAHRPGLYIGKFEDTVRMFIHEGKRVETDAVP